jgi:transcriptional regulator
MYIQQKFQETRPDVLHNLIKTYPLGAFVTLGSNGLEANHMPFQLDPSVQPHGVLRGHLPKSSPLWKDVGPAGPESLVIFQGPQIYVTPSWYPSKHAHGQAVPTWNYVVVHAYGRPVFTENPQWLLAHVSAMTNTHEAGQKLPWQVSDAPADYIDKMLAQIVGVEIPISRIYGKWKVSQNRPPADRLGVVAGLSSRDTEAASAVAALVNLYHGEHTPR